MSSNQDLQLFQFRVPNLPDTSLALWSVQVLDIVELDSVVDVPLSMNAIQGISRWHNEIIPIIDLANLLTDGGMPPDKTEMPWRYIIAHCVFDDQLIQIGIPILFGAKIVNITDNTQLPKLESDLLTPLVQVVLEIEEQPIHLIDLNKLGVLLPAESDFALLL